MMWTTVSMGVHTPLGFAEAVEACRQQLAAHGFGVITEIDMQTTLSKSLDVEAGPLVILGACHPLSAHEMLAIDPSLAVLLPCNVAISVEDGQTIVRALDPARVMGPVDLDSQSAAHWVRDELIEVLEDVRDVDSDAGQRV